LKVISVAKSPRIEPGAASIGLVAPIHRHERAARDELDQLRKERLALVLAVVALGELPVELHELQGGQLQALALESSDYLAGQAAVEGVRLYEDQSAVHQMV
jgi:hypothetical protein